MLINGFEDLLCHIDRDLCMILVDVVIILGFNVCGIVA